MAAPDSDRSKLIAVIDVGTSAVRFIIYSAPEFIEVCSQHHDIQQFNPKEGWVEQSPVSILNAVLLCSKDTCEQLLTLGYTSKDIIGIGITNQRETTVVWDKTTGLPLYNAIVWNDIRTSETVDQVLARLPEQNKDHFKSISGLTISTYFSALKIRWLIDNDIDVRKAVNEKRCLAGTIDTWLIWNLTGGPIGGLHVTDVTNASRTLLMNIETLNWDPLLLKTFSLELDMLPEIRSSSEIYGEFKAPDLHPLNGIKICAIMGNQQASLFGQKCFKKGQAKNTYRNGCFILCNTGEEKIFSHHGLITTVAYKLGKNAPAYYALEGSIAVGGAALKWLMNSLKIIKSAEETELLAKSVVNTGDVYFVPAFTGLYAPYWRKDARGIICGLTSYTTKHHIIRAALEAICFQTRDVLEAMKKDLDSNLSKLHADGELTANSILMQLQADLSGVLVLKTEHKNTTALGVAMAVSLAEGIHVTTNIADYPQYETFLPTTTAEDRNVRYTKWKMAIERSLGWSAMKKSETMTDDRYRLLASIPASVFIFSSFALLGIAKMISLSKR